LTGSGPGYPPAATWAMKLTMGGPLRDRHQPTCASQEHSIHNARSCVLRRDQDARFSHTGVTAWSAHVRALTAYSARSSALPAQCLLRSRGPVYPGRSSFSSPPKT
jgi:hypothetical protein